MTYNVANLTRSKTKELDLAKLISDCRPDLIILTETELPATDTITFPDYVSFLAPPSSLGTIRLAILARTHLASSAQLIEATPMDVWLRIPNLSFTVAAVYRQWSEPNEGAAIASFHERCLANTAKVDRVFVCGDFNLAFDRQDDPAYSRYCMLKDHLAAMSAAGLEYVGPFSPTFFSHGMYNGARRVSILDHGYAAGLTPTCVSVLDLATSDHRPVLFELPIMGSKTTKSFRLARSLRKVDKAVYCNIIEANLPPDLYSCEDVNAVHTALTTAITAALNQLAPLQPIIVRDGLNLNLAPDTLAAMKARDTAAKKGSSLYRSLRNKAARLVRRDKLNSTLKQIEEAGNDTKKMWRLARDATGSGASAIPATLTADVLNDFYIQKINKIRKSIPSIPINDPVQVSTMQPKFTFKYPSAGKVAKVMQGLKNTGAVGEDGISVAALKKGIPALAGPISHLVRLSLTSGKVPDGFKAATITPVFKGKGKSPVAAASYRPVAILPAMSKILESLVAECLSSHLQQLLPNSQFGFRPKRNAAAAIAYAHGEWSAARRAGNIVAIAAYDLSSAFDTVDFNILTTKLERLGISGSEKAWFADYLTSRRQRVSANGKMSSYRPVSYGVPQGSILGPILFLAMVAELPSILGAENGASIGYADDIIAWTCGSDAATVKSRLEAISDRVLDYTRSHFLALNSDKTQIMWLGTKAPLSVVVGGHSVPPSKSVEVLGVGFDHFLRPTPFITSQTIAAKRILGITRRLSYHLPPRAVSRMCNTLFMGKLGYAVAAAITPRLTQADPPTHGLQAWQVVINDAARCILGCRMSDRITIETLLTRAGLPSANRMAIRAAAIETWKAIKVRDGPDQSPNPLGSLIGDPGAGPKSTRSTTEGLLRPPQCNKDTLVWTSYRLWNSCEELRLAKSLPAAKRAAKKLAAAAPL